MREIKFRAVDSVTGEVLTQLYMGQCFQWVNCERQNNVIIEEFTGLQDRNGVDIYEGDILHHRKQGNCAVEYGNKYFDYAGFTLINSKGMTNTLQNPYIYEIIGNIHENSDLI